MIKRTLSDIAFLQKWGRQMRFVTGPRQAGKTTISKQKLIQEKAQKLYYLWDLREVRNRHKENELFFTEDSPPIRKKQWVCFDEIHKIPKWKNTLKAIFDSTHEYYKFIVTGSAKFDLQRKTGDSLAGRYFTFHLFPLTLSEILGTKKTYTIKIKTAREFILEKIETKVSAAQAVESLLELGSFPEPFVRHAKAFSKKWSQNYADTVIREDIGALTRIIDKEYVYDLYRLLPEMVASPVSEASISSHLGVSSPTVKNYLRRLEEFYLVFRIHPYAKNMKRSLLKAPKCYLYDWTQISDPGKRFENFIAAELFSKINLWTEASEDTYSLFYLRNKEKEETDFLILKNKEPWLMIEAKLSDGTILNQHYKTQAQLKGIPLVQICKQENVCKMEKKNSFRISASRFLL